MAEVLDDFDAFGGGGGAPVPSWKTMGVGGRTKGVILPQIHPKAGVLVAYLTTQQTSMPTEDKPAQPLTYDNGDPRTQAEFLVQTDIRDFRDCSRKFKEFAQENDVEDDGIRRVIVKGRSGSRSMQKNGRQTFGGQGRPEYGAYIDYTLLEQKPIRGTSYDENITECKFAKGDAASAKVVNDYLAENHSEFLGGVGDAFEDKTSAGSAPAGVGVKNSGDDPEF
jgi:hypothetical protein